MATWLGIISNEQRDDWAVMKERSAFGSDALIALSIQAGDELFVCTDDGGILARCRAVGDAPRPSATGGTRQDVESHLVLVPIEVLDEPGSPLRETDLLAETLRHGSAEGLPDVVQIDARFAERMTIALSKAYRPHREARSAGVASQMGDGAPDRRGLLTTGVLFSHLATADLVVEQTYLAGTAGHAGDDPLAVLLPVGNQGGFRYAGSPSKGTVRLVVLYTSGVNEDWPDVLDVATGTFTYYGDNRKPGSELHETPRNGNQILRSAFSHALAGPDGRAAVPPFLLFERANGSGRAVRFRGLLAPGTPNTPPDQQLVAIWRSRGGERFQNYRALFTVLDESVISRRWIQQLLAPGAVITTGSEAPPSWREWVEADSYRPLLAPPTSQHRSRAAQEPVSGGDRRLLDVLYAHFADRPTDFEPCAVELFRLQAPAVESVEVTRASRDGGRDAIGRYAIGPAADRVHLDFALEAKCYQPGNAVGVREVSRLISRLRFRQFGVLVTTSYVREQAYKEIREDGHPVVILSGADLVAILKTAGLGSEGGLRAWLQRRYPNP
ncbi:restriction endonuclease [Geodermatophilus sp. SYSU D00684]